MTTSSLPRDEIVMLEEVERSSAQTVRTMKTCMTDFAESAVGSHTVVVSTIHELWLEVVGSDVASHVKVKFVRDGVLHVTADHPAWSTQMKYMSDQIIERLSQNISHSLTSINVSISRS